MIWAPTSTVWTEICGRAACPPRPSISMVRRSAAAIRGAGRSPNCPTGRPGEIGMPEASPQTRHPPVLDHGFAAGPPLLGRLEDHDCGAGEVAGFGEIARRAEQHCGMTIVAAGMHLAGHRRSIWEIVRLLDRQCVHVGAQS